ncbi:hypothetical protein DYB25_005003 [Aphanomyces astaci]|uniref:Uncharacterized protein n=1 Tax=Aphanomyces astaci TaxID=112090 RepID=A0A397ALC5_APHAT|nr:hypothetical protein DYB25_005003 [Aphanomyces astaci]RHY38685.1 hypothetical protein DYB34_003855 [Aphanomyces astaci]RHY82216.1 hypothetical protein DYB31_000906 [Aphanomyces astaci]
MAMLCGVVALGNGGGISDNHFIDEYFYDDDAISLVTASTSIPSDFLGESVVLAVEQASVYKEFMLHASRTQDVVVFMSTSPDARQVFERAVRRLDDDALSTTRFFALPLPPPSSSPPDDDGAGFDEPVVSFHSLHSLPSIPKSGLHVVVTYPASGPRSLAVHASNAKMVQASTSEDDWVVRLQSQLASFTATPAPPSSPSSVMPSMMTVAIVLYVGVAVIPKVAANWQWWVTFCQSKRIWFGLSLFGLYLSLSGTPQQIFVDCLNHPQRQFALEGLFGGMLPFVVSAALLTITHGMPYLLNPDHRFHSVVMCAMVLGTTCFLEHALFTSKNRWYRLF